MKDNEPHIQAGSHSINLGQGNDVTNSSLHIGDVHNHGVTAEPVALIERISSRPIRLGGHQLQAIWLTVSGVLGFVASITSIAAYWSNLSVLVFPVLCVSAVFFFTGVCLTRQRFIRISPFPYNFEADSKGRVFITRIEGDCPKCDGGLRLREIGTKDHKVTVVRCTRNPDHLWRFDFTVLNDPSA